MAVQKILIVLIIIGIALLAFRLSFTGKLTGTTNVTISGTTSASLSVGSVAFGTMALNEANDTTDGSPLPFILNNDGNTVINVTMNATPIWSGSGATSTSGYYQFQSAENETGSVTNTTEDLVSSWTNVPANAAQVNAVTRFNYSDSSDTVKIHIKLTVPPDEPSGSKSSTITFTVSAA